MSRSRQKHPVLASTTTRSEKKDKQLANRSERRINKILLRTTLDDTQLKNRQSISDVWNWGKDGKKWATGHSEWLKKEMRK